MTAATTVEAAARKAPRRIASLKRRRFTRTQKVVITLVNLALFALAWELYSRISDVPSLLLPSFGAVLAEYPRMAEQGILWSNLLISLRIYLLGMGISMLVGVPLGLLIGGVRLFDKVVSPYLWALYTTPLLILMPLVLLWVGINNTARVVLILIQAIPAIAVVVMEGVKTVDNSLMKAARSFGASRLRLFRAVVFPSTVPFIATAVRMGVSRGLVGLFIGELFTAANGIGYIMVLAGKTFNSARTYALLLVFILFSVVMVSASQWLENRASVWRG